MDFLNFGIGNGKGIKSIFYFLINFFSLIFLRNGIHLAFFVGTSGVVRFKNESLDRFLYGFVESENSENSL